MAGFGAKLPLSLDYMDGIRLTKTLRETVRQNLKMLILTSPGERLMIPEYGVGIRNFLFEQNANQTKAHLTNRVIEQVETYMPFLSIEEISFTPLIDNINAIHIQIEYSTGNLSSRDVLEFDIVNDSFW